MIAESIFATGLVVAAGWDLQRRRVPNRLNLAILVAGLGARAVVGGPSAAVDGVLGAGLGLALLLWPFAARWIGGGDVKLVAACGAWLGAEGVLWTTLCGLALGGVVAAAMLAGTDRATRAEVAANLRSAVLLCEAPVAPQRRRALLVPLAVPLALAAIGVLWANGGWHAFV